MATIVQLGLLVLMGGSLLVILGTRVANYYRDKSTGITTNLIRFTAIIFIIPLIALLAIDGIVTPESVAIIFGTIIGFLLSGFDKGED